VPAFVEGLGRIGRAGDGDPGNGVPDDIISFADLQYSLNHWVASCT